MSKGFLLFAQNTNDVDYVEQAYALALSIKYSQKNSTPVSIITTNKLTKKQEEVFDEVIPVPWFGEALTEYATAHRWKFFHASPYDETIVLDTDMLLTEDISSWWDYCSNYDFRFCSRILNHKLEPVYDTIHRQTFIANKLSNPYFALHYFKKSDFAYEFYKVLEFVCNNWEWCWSKFAPDFYQNWPSMDLASAVAVEILGAHDKVYDVCSPLEFVHMKPMIQDWDFVPESWQDGVSCVLNSNGDLVVGNIKQPKLFHYVEKNFLNSSLIKQLEVLANGR